MRLRHIAKRVRRGNTERGRGRGRKRIAKSGGWGFWQPLKAGEGRVCAFRYLALTLLLFGPYGVVSTVRAKLCKPLC